MTIVRGYLGRFGADIGLLTGEPGAIQLLPGPSALNPNYLALSDDGARLYAAIRDPDGNEVGAWAVEDDTLRPFGSQPSGGEGLCHLTVDSSGTHVISTHYGSGSVAVHPISDDGSLEELSDLVQHAGSGPHERQDRPHAHQVVNDPTGEFLLVVDLGTDTIVRYRLLGSRLQAVGRASLPAGAGPRHLALNPARPYAYVANELDSTASILDLTAFEIVSTVSTAAEGMGGHESQPSAIRVADDGRFCYVANRRMNTVAVFGISADGSSLTLKANVPCGGDHPRDLILDGDYLYVANQYSDSIDQFLVDRETGIPTSTENPLSTPAPMCLLLRPGG